MHIYLATSNAGKLRDLRAIAAAHPEIVLDLIPREALTPAPAETESTFEGNARLKAAEYSRRLPHSYVLADDSGLEVDALAGAPGVHSARYAATDDEEGNTDDEANNAKLLRELTGVPDVKRGARFVCVLALARDSVIEHVAYGAVDGVILHRARGDAGFGYDPLFLVPELGVTFAELTPEQKGAYSHRGRAFRTLLSQLS